MLATIKTSLSLLKVFLSLGVSDCTREKTIRTFTDGKLNDRYYLIADQIIQQMTIACEKSRKLVTGYDLEGPTRMNIWSIVFLQVSCTCGAPGSETYLRNAVKPCEDAFILHQKAFFIVTNLFKLITVANFHKLTASEEKCVLNTQNQLNKEYNVFFDMATAIARLYKNVSGHYDKYDITDICLRPHIRKEVVLIQGHVFTITKFIKDAIANLAKNYEESEEYVFFKRAGLVLSVVAFPVFVYPALFNAFRTPGGGYVCVDKKSVREEFIPYIQRIVNDGVAKYCGNEKYQKALEDIMSLVAVLFKREKEYYTHKEISFIAKEMFDEDFKGNLKECELRLEYCFAAEKYHL